ncbi:hypothetical protein J2847_006453 [Azospirillum agricola]|uniref:hypothetical protein n=1 Tax=Azospirillum agricola TaxID=1720247 RepID=UPI001AEB9CB5|nr:hypothetical protein [Azospirillum agricola]MBP2233118.1 hypothetical protein [Azospirillum agricola]
MAEADDATDPAAFMPTDLNTTINHEPRILDLRLAQGLGFAQPRDIRKLIERHLPALQRLGRICAMVAQIRGRGRPATEYWLTKKQAIYIATKSETDRATDITIAVVEVFDAAAAGAVPGLSEIEADVVGQLRRMTPAQRERLRTAAVAGGLKSQGSASAPGAATLPPPAPEPFFCTDCAVRREWLSRPELRERAAARPPGAATYADLQHFPMLGGPITNLEIGLMTAFRIAQKEGAERIRQEALRTVAAALDVPIGEVPAVRRLPAPPKKGA